MRTFTVLCPHHVKEDVIKMGFFSEIVSEARRGQVQQPAPQPVAAPMPAAPEVKTTQPPAVPEPSAGPAPAPAPVPAVYPAKDGPKPATPVQPVVQAAPEPQPQSDPPSIDLTPEAGTPDDAAKRKAHEAAEAKRKVEFDAKQAEKRAKRQAALDRIAAMDSAELLDASVERVATDTERLTRRNMKESVAEHIQAKCREDAAFARLVMDPAKSMVNCFRYINRQAQAYAEQEMKDQGIQRTGVYGLDVPDGLCYQWAEDYFKDENAKEDHQDDEKFTPKPYVPASTPRKTAKGKADKKPAPVSKPKVEKSPKDASMEQMTLGVM